MQWFKKWDQFINENLFVSKIKDDVMSIMTKCGYQHLNFKSVFELNDDQDLDVLCKSSDFLKKLQGKQLRATDLEKSSETSSLVLNPIQFVLLYNEADAETENPKYMLIQDATNGKNGKIQLFYLTAEINKFFDYLTNRIIEVTKSDSDKKWIYKTTNAGENWTLQNKSTASGTMKEQMYGDELADLEQNKIISIEIK